MFDVAPLRARVEAMGIAPPAEFYAQAALYAARLAEKNKVMNLTAIREEELILRHFVDSVEAAQIIDFAGKKVIDIGCGAGFPGMPLKLLFPTMKITLLDSTAKKLAFIAETAAELGVEIEILPARAEEAAQDTTRRERYDLALSRAVANMSALCELCLPFVKKGGSFIAYKTMRAREELSAAGSALKLLGGEFSFERPYLLADSENLLVGVKKISQTPSKYPRKYAQIKQKPL